MAEACVSRCWPDGEALTVSVEVEGAYPDAVAEATAACRRLYAEALDITLTPADDEAGE